MSSVFAASTASKDVTVVPDELDTPEKVEK